MTYDIVILVIGGLAAFGAIRAAIDMSRNRFYVVGLVHPDAKNDKHSQEKQTSSEPTDILIPTDETVEPSIHTFRADPLSDEPIFYKAYSGRHGLGIAVLRKGKGIPREYFPGSVEDIKEKEHQEAAEQAKAFEHHAYRLDELEKRIRQLEEKQLVEEQSPEWQERLERQSATESSRLVH